MKNKKDEHMHLPTVIIRKNLREKFADAAGKGILVGGLKLAGLKAVALTLGGTAAVGATATSALAIGVAVAASAGGAYAWAYLKEYRRERLLTRVPGMVPGFAPKFFDRARAGKVRSAALAGLVSGTVGSTLGLAFGFFAHTGLGESLHEHAGKLLSRVFHHAAAPPAPAPAAVTPPAELMSSPPPAPSADGVSCVLPRPVTAGPDCGGVLDAAPAPEPAPADMLHALAGTARDGHHARLAAALRGVDPDRLDALSPQRKKDLAHALINNVRGREASWDVRRSVAMWLARDAAEHGNHQAQVFVKDLGTLAADPYAAHGAAVRAVAHHAASPALKLEMPVAKPHHVFLRDLPELKIKPAGPLRLTQPSLKMPPLDAVPPPPAYKPMKTAFDAAAYCKIPAPDAGGRIVVLPDADCHINRPELAPGDSFACVTTETGPAGTATTTAFVPLTLGSDGPVPTKSVMMQGLDLCLQKISATRRMTAAMLKHGAPAR